MKYLTFMMVAIFTLISSRADSQLIRSYGAKIGITEASQDWKYTGALSDLKIYDKSRTGLDIGGYVEWLDLAVLSIITEAHYIQKGCKDEFEVTTVEMPQGTGETKLHTPRIDYMSFPVLAKLRFDTPILTLYGIGGYRIDFLVGKNSYASGAVFDDLKSTDQGPTIGFGIEAPITSKNYLGGEFRYSFSSQEIFSNQNLTVKNKSMEFLFIVGF
jgi:opacity protein-like surface antigen